MRGNIIKVNRIVSIYFINRLFDVYRQISLNDVNQLVGSQIHMFVPDVMTLFFHHFQPYLIQYGALTVEEVQVGTIRVPCKKLVVFHHKNRPLGQRLPGRRRRVFLSFGRSSFAAIANSYLNEMAIAGFNDVFVKRHPSRNDHRMRLFGVGPAVNNRVWPVDRHGFYVDPTNIIHEIRNSF